MGRMESDKDTHLVPYQQLYHFNSIDSGIPIPKGPPLFTCLGSTHFPIPTIRIKTVREMYLALRVHDIDRKASKKKSIVYKNLSLPFTPSSCQSFLRISPP